MNYYECGDIGKILSNPIKKFMQECINKTGVTYAVLPVIVDKANYMDKEEYI